jgi:uncharacterized protein
MKLLVFTRFPEPGKVKTRLVPALGNEGACRVHKEMTEYTLTVLLTSGAELEIWFEGGDEGSMRSWLGQNLRYRPQRQGDLGAKLIQAFVEAFSDNEDCVAAVGCDCPDLTSEHIREAFSRLREFDLVLGPAKDGGYYLIGMRTPQTNLFKEINWGSKYVLQQTLAIAMELGLKVSLLEELADVDRPEDLPVWLRKNAK